MGVPVIGCGGIAAGNGAVAYMPGGGSGMQIGTATSVMSRGLTGRIDAMNAHSQPKELDCLARLTRATAEAAGRGDHLDIVS